jgi:hypothetical protein
MQHFDGRGRSPLWNLEVACRIGWGGMLDQDRKAVVNAVINIRVP